MLTERNSKNLLIFGAIIFIVGVILFIWKESYSLNSEIDAEKIAQFGDFIGGVIGAIWSLAGVILFYVALTEQRKDIKINRETLEAQVKALNQQIKEFELQRNELEETKEVFKEQSITLKIQRFETTLFQLINLHNENIDKLHLKRHYLGNRASIYGNREVLIQAQKELDEIIERDISIKESNPFGGDSYHRIEIKNKEDAEKRLLESYKKFYFNNFNQLLSHYFRNIYHVFKFIYTSKLIEKENKQFYASIVRAQLSSFELYIILYNGIYNGLGYPNFLFLIKEFDLMQNFDFNLVNKFPFHVEIYTSRIENVQPEFDIE